MTAGPVQGQGHPPGSDVGAALVRARDRGWSIVLVGGQPVVTAPLRSLDLLLLDVLLAEIDAVTDLLEEEVARRAETDYRPGRLVR
jgi:hypothetical protein